MRVLKCLKIHLIGFLSEFWIHPPKKILRRNFSYSLTCCETSFYIIEGAHYSMAL